MNMESSLYYHHNQSIDNINQEITMDSNQIYFYMEDTPYQSQGPYMVPVQGNAYHNEAFYYQSQDLQSSPQIDYSFSSDSGKSTPETIVSEAQQTSYWNPSYEQIDQSPQSQSSHIQLEESEELFDNILMANISSEQMDEMLQTIEFDDQLLDFEALDTFDTSDYSDTSLYSLSTPTSAQSSPKRKYSSSSSTTYYSSSSSCYDGPSCISSSASNFSDECLSPPLKKQRKPRKTLPDRKERKKEQNKKAAIKYREKKKNQQQQCDGDVSELEEKHKLLMSQLSSLQNELKVILPLAGAAFATNAYKKQQLHLLMERIGELN